MNYPKIGIRPAIDGRQGGVRESLEAQTMAMAEAAKLLIEGELRYADGEPVQCVVASRTIGGRADAEAVRREFLDKNVVATLTVTPCWCYGTETLDLDPMTIKAVWGFNGTERPGAVYLAAAMAAHAQCGLPAFKIYGHDVQDADDKSIPSDVAEKIIAFARAAMAVGQMRGQAYVNLGASAMGIAGSQVSVEFFQKYLGMSVEFVDMTEILRRMALRIYDEDEVGRARAWIEEKCPEGVDINAGKDLPEVITASKVVPADQDWDFIARQVVIIRDILFGNPRLADMGWLEESRGRNAIAGGFQGQRQWTDWLPNGDFAEAILTSTFDWNGARRPTAFATENDTLNGASMLLGTLLTNTAPVFSDVRTYWSPEAVERVCGKRLEGRAAHGVLHLINSGATALDASGAVIDGDGSSVMKPFWEMTEGDIDSKTAGEMPLTMIRLNMVAGVGPTLQIAEGHTCVLPDDIHRTLDDRTDKTWPTTWFAPRLGAPGFESVWDVMNHWGANHGASVYGHVGADLITLASMLRIPVTLHNVENDRLFRPSMVDGFGTKDLEAADLAYCNAMGPLYRG